METKNNNRSLIVLIVIGVLILCVGATSAGFMAYTFVSRIADTPNMPAITDVANNEDPYTEEDFVEPEVIEANEATDEVDIALIFSPLWEVRELLQQYFINQPIDDTVLAGGAIDGLQLLLEDREIDLTNTTLPVDAITPQEFSELANTPQESVEAFLPFWEVWQQAYYAELDEYSTYVILSHEAIAGMVRALGDDHTTYLNPHQFEQSQMRMEGSYEGIGAWVDASGDYLTIISPMNDSPAERAGLLPGDKIITIDGEEMKGIPGDLVIQHVLGPAGTNVTFTIEREGEPEYLTITVTRAEIELVVVESEMLDNGIGYIKLNNFGQTSDVEFHNALEAIMDQNPSGLIVDLRNNGGGYLQASVNIASEFINEGPITYEEYGDGSRYTHNFVEGGLATGDIPLVILVNEGSASASEVVAGAIQDYQRGVLMGVTTFGKGSAQAPVTLSNGQGSVRITIAKWLTPLERHIHGIGLDPDIVVEMTVEDFEAEIDPQLDAAIDYLLNQ